MPRQTFRRPYRARPRFVRLRPWQWSRSVLLAMIELPVRLLAALWAGSLVWGWLGEEGVVYVDLIESRYLLLAVVGTAALAATAAPLLTTRPALWGVELLGRLGPYRLVGAALGAIVGLVVGLLLALPLPRLEDGLGVWLPFALTAGCGLAGALAFAGRPGLVRRALGYRRPAGQVVVPAAEAVPTLPAPANGQAPVEIEAPIRETRR